MIAGFASSLYFAINEFLPDYLRWRGHADLPGPALSALNWVQIPASVLMLVYAERLTRTPQAIHGKTGNRFAVR